MKPYEEYKETGLDWLPRVPKHWGMKKIQTFAKPKSIRKNMAGSLAISPREGIVSPA